MSSSTTVSASFATKRSGSPEPSQPQKITLKVKNQQDGHEDLYKIGVNAHMKKLFTAFCEKRHFDRRAVKFIYNQKVINSRQTPAQLRMQDEDLIDAVTEQPGGGLFSTA